MPPRGPEQNKRLRRPGRRSPPANGWRHETARDRGEISVPPGVSEAKGPVAGTTDVTQADNTGGTRHGLHTSQEDELRV
jgi:hypothetical protein